MYGEKKITETMDDSKDDLVSLDAEPEKARLRKTVYRSFGKRRFAEYFHISSSGNRKIQTKCSAFTA